MEKREILNFYKCYLRPLGQYEIGEVIWVNAFGDRIKFLRDGYSSQRTSLHFSSHEKQKIILLEFPLEISQNQFCSSFISQMLEETMRGL